MLHTFLSAHRTELIDRCRSKVALRAGPTTIEAELEYGIPLFLDQLIKTLQMEQGSEPMRSRRVSGASGGDQSVLSEIGTSATQHGRELSRSGFSVDQVVHNYGDLCQAIMEVATERRVAIRVDEFQTLNRCLDNAMADAVAEFAFQHASGVTARDIQAMNERLGILAHELRNLIHTATLAFRAIKAGGVGIAGATGAVLERSLIGLRTIVERSLADVRLTVGMPARHQLISVADFIDEVKVAASLEAQAHECDLAVSVVDSTLAVAADRDMLFAALGNVLQNAFKFTHHRTGVSMKAYAVADRVHIDVEDNCGGLPPGGAENMFLPFTQNNKDKSGLGLGLSICRRSVEAFDGVLRVRDVPGTGCIFTIDLPRHLFGKGVAAQPSGDMQRLQAAGAA